MHWTFAFLAVIEPHSSIGIMNEGERFDELISVATPDEVVSIPS